MKASVSDDLDMVVLDLHGLKIDRAISISRKAIGESYYRGRDKIKLIHGSSTSSLQFVNSTIKHRIYELLNEASIQSMINYVSRLEDYCVVDLRPDYEIDRQNIKFSDLN